MSAGAVPGGWNGTYWARWTLARHASVAESLEDGEAWIGGWDGVGLYDGNSKVDAYQSVTLHLTTHRLLLLPDAASGDEHTALQVDLRHVRQTEFYAGFMRSSPKITVEFGPATGDDAAPAASVGPGPSSVPSTPTPGSPAAASAPSVTAAPTPAAAAWACGVCGFANPLSTPGASPPPGAKCALCGVAYAMSRTMSAPPSRATTPAGRTGPAPTSASTTSSHAPSPVPTPAPPPAPRDSQQVACPACTFLNHPSLAHCEICGTALPRTTSRGKAKAPPPVLGKQTARLSFRRGGEREAYRRLKGVLTDKVWERTGVNAGTRPGSAAGANENKLGGIDAIIKSMSLEGRANDAHMQDAFRDLEVLMVRAGEMVRLAQSLNAKLSAAGGKDDAEATLVRSSLVRLGLPAPALTPDMVRDERAYFEGLARELGSILTGRGGGAVGGGSGLMLQAGHGVIALDSVWGLWMRARGVALLPPATLMAVLPHLPQHTSPPIRRLDLPSGLTVLYTPHYAPDVFLTRLVSQLAPPSAPEHAREAEEEMIAARAAGSGAPPVLEHAARRAPGMSIVEIAAVEGLPIGLATELVDLVAAAPPRKSGVGVVRDDQAPPSDGGTKWYADVISQWPLADGRTATA